MIEGMYKMNKQIKYKGQNDIRNSLIILLSSNLDKNSRFYAEDYANILKAVNTKTDAEVLEAMSRHRAIASVGKKEIMNNCQI